MPSIESKLNKPEKAIEEDKDNKKEKSEQALDQDLELKKQLERRSELLDKILAKVKNVLESLEKNEFKIDETIKEIKLEDYNKFDEKYKNFSAEKLKKEMNELGDRFKNEERKRDEFETRIKDYLKSMEELETERIADIDNLNNLTAYANKEIDLANRVHERMFFIAQEINFVAQRREFKLIEELDISLKTREDIEKYRDKLRGKLYKLRSGIFKKIKNKKEIKEKELLFEKLNKFMDDIWDNHPEKIPGAGDFYFVKNYADEHNRKKKNFRKRKTELANKTIAYFLESQDKFQEKIENRESNKKDKEENRLDASQIDQLSEKFIKKFIAPEIKRVQDKRSEDNLSKEKFRKLEDIIKKMSTVEISNYKNNTPKNEEEKNLFVEIKTTLNYASREIFNQLFDNAPDGKANDSFDLADSIVSDLNILSIKSEFKKDYENKLNFLEAIYNQQEDEIKDDLNLVKNHWKDRAKKIRKFQEIDDVLDNLDVKRWQVFRDSQIAQDRFSEDKLKKSEKLLSQSYLKKLVDNLNNTEKSIEWGKKLMFLKNPENMPLVIMNAYRERGYGNTRLFLDKDNRQINLVILTDYINSLPEETLSELQEESSPELIKIIDLIKNNPKTFTLANIENPKIKEFQNKLYQDQEFLDNLLEIQKEKKLSNFEIGSMKEGENYFYQEIAEFVDIEKLKEINEEGLFIHYFKGENRYLMRPDKLEYYLKKLGYEEDLLQNKWIANPVREEIKENLGKLCLGYLDENIEIDQQLLALAVLEDSAICSLEVKDYEKISNFFKENNNSQLDAKVKAFWENRIKKDPQAIEFVVNSWDTLPNNSKKVIKEVSFYILENLTYQKDIDENKLGIYADIFNLSSEEFVKLYKLTKSLKGFQNNVLRFRLEDQEDLAKIKRLNLHNEKILRLIEEVKKYPDSQIYVYDFLESLKEIEFEKDKKDDFQEAMEEIVDKILEGIKNLEEKKKKKQNKEKEEEIINDLKFFSKQYVLSYIAKNPEKTEEIILNFSTLAPNLIKQGKLLGDIFNQANPVLYTKEDLVFLENLLNSNKQKGKHENIDIELICKIVKSKNDIISIRKIIDTNKVNEIETGKIKKYLDILFNETHGANKRDELLKHFYILEEMIRKIDEKELSNFVIDEFKEIHSQAEEEMFVNFLAKVAYYKYSQIKSPRLQVPIGLLTWRMFKDNFDNNDEIKDEEKVFQFFETLKTEIAKKEKIIENSNLAIPKDYSVSIGTEIELVLNGISRTEKVTKQEIIDYRKNLQNRNDPRVGKFIEEFIKEIQPKIEEAKFQYKQDVNMATLLGVGMGADATHEFANLASDNYSLLLWEMQELAKLKLIDFDRKFLQWIEKGMHLTISAESNGIKQDENAHLLQIAMIITGWSTDALDGLGALEVVGNVNDDSEKLYKLTKGFILERSLLKDEIFEDQKGTKGVEYRGLGIKSFEHLARTLKSIHRLAIALKAYQKNKEKIKEDVFLKEVRKKLEDSAKIEEVISDKDLDKFLAESEITDNKVRKLILIWSAFREATVTNIKNNQLKYTQYKLKNPLDVYNTRDYTRLGGELNEIFFQSHEDTGELREDAFLPYHQKAQEGSIVNEERNLVIQARASIENNLRKN